MDLTKPFFTVHYYPAMQKGQFSIWTANIDNTPEKRAKAAELFHGEDWHIEYHIMHYDMTPVIR